MPLTHGSLFSGIGGAELAATWAGFANLFHCDISPFGRAVLDYWYPHSKSYDDITKSDFSEWRGRVTVLSGGFPCQPFSCAGSRRGAGDDRYLWPQMLRVINQVRPTWVVGENVAGLTSMVEPVGDAQLEVKKDLFGADYVVRSEHYRYTLERVCCDLEKAGYTVQPVIIPAAAVGAPHRRDRVWFLARREDGAADEAAHTDGWRGDGGKSLPDIWQLGDACARACERVSAVAHTDGQRLYPHHGGERDEPHQSQEQGRTEHLLDEPCRPGCAGVVAHPDGRRPQKGDAPLPGGGGAEDDKDAIGRGVEPGDRERPPMPDWERFPTQPAILGGDDGLPPGLACEPLYVAPRGKRNTWRPECIKALGNAWVPQVAYEIFRAIAEIEKTDTTNKQTQ